MVISRETQRGIFRFLISARRKVACKRLVISINFKASLLLFFSSRRRHTIYWLDWSSDVCSSDLPIKMEIKDIKAVYFIGAGGIGMSAIARYFINKGVLVAGYDKTPSDLTRQLEKEGMLIHYEENCEEIPQACRNKSTCLVIYTPAVPETHQELVYFRENGFEIEKRAQVLGTLTRDRKSTRL